MTALVIDSQSRAASRRGRAHTVRPARRQAGVAATTLPRASRVVPLRSPRAAACTVPAATGGDCRGELGEWHLTAKGSAVVGLLMAATMMLGLVVVILQYVATPA